MILLLLLACIKTDPAPLYPVQAVAPVEPPVVTAEPSDQECPLAAPMVPGRPPPYTDAEGNATCAAQVVPESQVIGLLAADDAADYWARVAQIGHEHRLRDRAWAEQSIQQCRQQLRVTEGDLRTHKAVTPVVFVGGILVGVGVGLAAAHLAP